MKSKLTFNITLITLITLIMTLKVISCIALESYGTTELYTENSKANNFSIEYCTQDTKSNVAIYRITIGEEKLSATDLFTDGDNGWIYKITPSDSSYIKSNGGNDVNYVYAYPLLGFKYSKEGILKSNPITFYYADKIVSQYDSKKNNINVQGSVYSFKNKKEKILFDSSLSLPESYPSIPNPPNMLIRSPSITKFSSSDTAPRVYVPDNGSAAIPIQLALTKDSGEFISNIDTNYRDVYPCLRDNKKKFISLIGADPEAFYTKIAIFAAKDNNQIVKYESNFGDTLDTSDGSRENDFKTYYLIEHQGILDHFYFSLSDTNIQVSLSSISIILPLYDDHLEINNQELQENIKNLTAIYFDDQVIQQNGYLAPDYVFDVFDLDKLNKRTGVYIIFPEGYNKRNITARYDLSSMEPGLDISPTEVSSIAQSIYNAKYTQPELGFTKQIDNENFSYDMRDLFLGFEPGKTLYNYHFDSLGNYYEEKYTIKNITKPGYTLLNISLENDNSLPVFVNNDDFQWDSSYKRYLHQVGISGIPDSSTKYRLFLPPNGKNYTYISFDEYSPSYPDMYVDKHTIILTPLALYDNIGLKEFISESNFDWTGVLDNLQENMSSSKALWVHIEDALLHDNSEGVLKDIEVGYSSNYLPRVYKYGLIYTDASTMKSIHNQFIANIQKGEDLQGKTLKGQLNYELYSGSDITDTPILDMIYKPQDKHFNTDFPGYETLTLHAIN